MSIAATGPSSYAPPPSTEESVFDESLISDDMYLIDHLSTYQTVSSQRNCESLFPLGFQKDQTYLPRAFEKVKEHPAYDYWIDFIEREGMSRVKKEPEKEIQVTPHPSPPPRFHLPFPPPLRKSL